MINSMNGACCLLRLTARAHTAPLLTLACAFACRVAVCAESRMFGNFSETKNFVSLGTWGLVGAFLVLSAIVALKH